MPASTFSSLFHGSAEFTGGEHFSYTHTHTHYPILPPRSMSVHLFGFPSIVLKEVALILALLWAGNGHQCLEQLS